MKPPCSIDGCEKPSKNFGWCLAHYTRARRHGSPTGSRPRPTALDRFNARVVRQEGCWGWTGWTDRDGYASLNYQDRPYRAHRFAYEVLVGPIPAGLVLDHLCRNRGCVNPEHLEPVTNAENVRRGEAAHIVASRRSVCKRNHELTEDNIYRPPGKPTHRECRECRRQYGTKELRQ